MEGSNKLGGVIVGGAPESFLQRCLLLYRVMVCFAALALSVPCAIGSPPLDTTCPVGFFTNLASRLLKSEMNLDLNRIQIYPTNQYTPAVHRWLQVTANLYDSTTNRSELTDYPYLPTVFRPRFTNENGCVFISGYVEETNAAFLYNRIWDLSSSTDVASLDAVQLDDSFYNVPLVIGAKKGFPNFNEFSASISMTVVRQLQFHKSDARVLDQTNQIYMFCISNRFGAELWNSYSNAFPRDLQLTVGANVSYSLTNELGILISSNLTWVEALQTIPANSWTGFNVNTPNSGLFVPILTNAQVQPWFTNRFSFPGDGFPIPRWWLNAQGRVRMALIDSATGRIVDYAGFSVQNGPGDVTQMLMSGGSGQLNSTKQGDQWWTNTIGNGMSPIGVVNQILVGLGPPLGPSPSSIGWLGLPPNPGYPGDIAAIQDRFYYNMLGFNKPGDSTRYPYTNFFYAPFSPIRTVFQTVQLQANDPLVRWVLSDLTDGFSFQFDPDIDMANPTNGITGGLGKVNRHYNPWGGNQYIGQPNANALNPAIKDPMVRSSDSWNFPTNCPLSFATIGRIHRGTPWQTIYLKSSDTNLSIWSSWIGDNLTWNLGGTSVADASLSRPVMDRDLISLLAPILGTNRPNHQLSVNDPNTNLWCVALDGLQVETNSSPVTTLVISSTSPQVALIAQAVASTRPIPPGPDPRGFRHLGEVLATPQFSDQSPYLNTSQLNSYLAGGINDEMLEAIPSQLLPLLREDFSGFVTRSNEQWLVEFSGNDFSTFVVECSSNLVDWIPVSTNNPVGGVFSLPMPLPPAGVRQYFRSRWQD